MKAKQQQLQAQDITIKIEVAFMTSMAGAGGAAVLEHLFLSLLPVLARGVLLGDAVAAARVLGTSSLFKFSSPSCQGQVKAALSFLVSIQSGRRPALPVTGTTFINQVVERLPFFVRRQQGEETVVGGAAVRLILRQLQAQVMPLTLADVGPLMIWDWLLDDAEKKEAVALVRGVVGQVAAAAAVGGGAAPPPKKKAKKGGVPAADPVAEANAFFA